MNTPAVERIIFPADVESLSELERFAMLLKGKVGMFKVGKQLFTACGPDAVKMLIRQGYEVFLDPKYFDIPNTVAKAGIAAANLGVKMFNVHALGGFEMMNEAVKKVRAHCAKEKIRCPLMLAVTILTSSTEKTLAEVGINLPVKEMVVKLAKLAKEAGMDGVVASPLEISSIREECGPDFIIVTPGVRPAGSSNDDQKRVMTPGEAIVAGADYLVVGRPISAAPDPLDAAEKIVEEVYMAQIRRNIPAGQASHL